MRVESTTPPAAAVEAPVEEKPHTEKRGRYREGGREEATDAKAKAAKGEKSEKTERTDKGEKPHSKGPQEREKREG